MQQLEFYAKISLQEHNCDVLTYINVTVLQFQFDIWLSVRNRNGINLTKSDHYTTS